MLQWQWPDCCLLGDLRDAGFEVSKVSGYFSFFFSKQEVSGIVRKVIAKRMNVSGVFLRLKCW